MAPCTGITITPGTLSSAQYIATYSYDSSDRLTGGPLGTYSYGDSAHKDAATAIGTVYTASYDAAGNMTCRAPTNAATCTGSNPTGAQLTYDNEGRLKTWSSASGSTANLYDGEGNRVEQQVTSGGSSTTITYIGGIEEVAASSGGGTITTTYYSAGGHLLAEGVNLCHLLSRQRWAGPRSGAGYPWAGPYGPR